MTNPTTPHIAVIGAGAGGLTFAIALTRQLGYENFIIYEKASDVGGTWRGCTSDVPVHFFSLSTDLNPNWPSTHGNSDEIQRYWKQLSIKYAIESHIAYNHLVHSATWDPAAQLYHIVVEDLKTGTKTSTSANILISAVGILEVPRAPDIPGVKDFAGDVFHSARWNNSVELRGRKVAVRANYSPLSIWTFRNIPFAMRLYRWWLFLRSEIFYYAFFRISWSRGRLTKMFRNYILKNAPEKYHKYIAPTYTLGCKRMIFDTNYIATLHKPNMDVNWDGIDRITADGILTKTGEKLCFDVIIFATGFTADKYPINIRGSKGMSVQDYYDSQMGPKAYLGTSVPGFPNFFMVSGGISVSDLEVDYIIKLIKPILNEDVLSFEVTNRATDAYNDKIQGRLSKSYRTGRNGRVTSIFPGTSTQFWWWLRRPLWKHYIRVGGESSCKLGPGEFDVVCCEEMGTRKMRESKIDWETSMRHKHGEL
ncbi:hypothetical protein BD779DRAFT_1611364 [Infundibulicybe gibba]|nr:hypothetical protein BD779DRAFT_1611364 [Infundibulicybe gibba]